jgi:hypothetical protein
MLSFKILTPNGGAFRQMLWACPCAVMAEVFKSAPLYIPLPPKAVKSELKSSE